MFRGTSFLARKRRKVESSPKEPIDGPKTTEIIKAKPSTKVNQEAIVENIDEEVSTKLKSAAIDLKGALLGDKRCEIDYSKLVGALDGIDVKITSAMFDGISVQVTRLYTLIIRVSKTTEKYPVNEKDDEMSNDLLSICKKFHVAVENISSSMTSANNRAKYIEELPKDFEKLIDGFENGVHSYESKMEDKYGHVSKILGSGKKALGHLKDITFFTETFYSFAMVGVMLTSGAEWILSMSSDDPSSYFVQVCISLCVQVQKFPHLRKMIPMYLGILAAYGTASLANTFVAKNTAFDISIPTKKLREYTIALWRMAFSAFYPYLDNLFKVAYQAICSTFFHMKSTHTYYEFFELVYKHMGEVAGEVSEIAMTVVVEGIGRLFKLWDYSIGSRLFQVVEALSSAASIAAESLLYGENYSKGRTKDVIIINQEDGQKRILSSLSHDEKRSLSKQVHQRRSKNSGNDLRITGGFGSSDEKDEHVQALSLSINDDLLFTLDLDLETKNVEEAFVDGLSIIFDKYNVISFSEKVLDNTCGRNDSVGAGCRAFYNDTKNPIEAYVTYDAFSDAMFTTDYHMTAVIAVGFLLGCTGLPSRLGSFMKRKLKSK